MYTRHYIYGLRTDSWYILIELKTMRSRSHIKIIVILLFVCSQLTSAEDACRSQRTGYDLSSLKKGYDYETEEYTYMGLDWVIVYNFCTNTLRTCMATHFAAYANSPNRGLRCSPTLTSGDWYDAIYAGELSGTRKFSMRHFT